MGRLKNDTKPGAAIMCWVIPYTRPHDLSLYLLTWIQIIGVYYIGPHSPGPITVQDPSSNAAPPRVRIRSLLAGPPPWDRNPPFAFYNYVGRVTNEKLCVLWGPPEANLPVGLVAWGGFSFDLDRRFWRLLACVPAESKEGGNLIGRWESRGVGLLRLVTY